MPDRSTRTSLSGAPATLRYRAWIFQRNGVKDWKIVYANNPQEAETYARKRWGTRFLTIGEIYDRVNERERARAEAD